VESESVRIKLVVMGNGAISLNVPAGMTVAELRELQNINPDIEIRINGTTVDDNFVINENLNGSTFIGATNVKGGV